MFRGVKSYNNNELCYFYVRKVLLIESRDCYLLNWYVKNQQQVHKQYKFCISGMFFLNYDVLDF